MSEGNMMLEVKDLTKRYENFTLDGVTFSLPKGSIMGLIGENGAGKSTTVNAILELIHKDGGEILFWGKELTPQMKEDIGVVFDGLNFAEGLTPKKAGKISAAAYKQWDSEVYDGYLRRFELPTDKKIKTFSKGMKAKLAIALALSHSPKLLVLDEATVGLDPVVRADILDIFLDFVSDEEHTVLMSSHITTDLEKVADYITFIHKGRVLFCKKKDELIYKYGIIRCKKQMLDSIAEDDILSVVKDDLQYNVLVSDIDGAKKKYKDAVIDNATIDDIILLYVKGEKQI